MIDIFADAAFAIDPVDAVAVVLDPEEPELDPEELKASEEEKQGKTPEEVEEIEREKFDNQFDKQTI